MTEKIPCTKCGLEILPATAERTGGLCRPCAQGSGKPILIHQHTRLIAQLFGRDRWSAGACLLHWITLACLLLPVWRHQSSAEITILITAIGLVSFFVGFVLLARNATAGPILCGAFVFALAGLFVVVFLFAPIVYPIVWLLKWLGVDMGDDPNANE